MLNIQKAREGNSFLLTLTGRLDTSGAPALETEVRAVFPEAEALIFDFSELDYISSAGLRVLLLSRKEMENRGSVVVRGANETVLEIFEMTGFSSLLTLEQQADR